RVAELGCGLDRSAGGVTGAPEARTPSPPRTGRAVCRGEAAPYAPKLLELPRCMAGSGKIEEGDIARGLALTGYFLERRVLWPIDKQLPEARTRLMAELGRVGRL
uniref:DNA repair protein RecO C-terminal domain-containing protein n=1 Tax=uncultured Maricaulis sp. TaxID=174710 RepID=UPI0030DA0F51